jgi:uncharacterized membrane protein
MFEFLFKYSPSAFSKGHFVFLTPWPLWLLVLLAVAAGVALYFHVRRSNSILTGIRPIFIWLLETALVAMLLLLLWHPALSIATLRPQQNVVTVLVDHSRSMGIQENGSSRLSKAQAVWKDKLASSLSSRFQVRMYDFGKDLARIENIDQPKPDSPATRIGDTLTQIASEASTLPIGAVVLMSDGAENSGGLDADTIAKIRQARIPIHTIGFGKESLATDIEIMDASVPSRALAGARLSAQVTFRQFGFNGQKTRITIKDSGKVIASQDVTMKSDATAQTENVVFSAGAAGPRSLQVSMDPQSGEENVANNALSRLVNVSSRKMRILYFEGEPRWEYKFMRRAVEDDNKTVEIVSMLRTTPNKIYRQGISNPTELENGFPTKAEELFAYDGLIIGSSEASYFTPQQQQLIRDFADRRGGGVLFLGGRFGLSDGGYARSPLAEIMPVRLPTSEQTFHRDYSTVQLAQAGRESAICRLVDGRDQNVERWKKMPQIANYQEVGEVKPGAVTLLNVAPAGRKISPLLVIQNFGRGRTAVLATGGTWRWQMQQDLKDMTHEVFWQQLLRWLVSETPGQVAASTPRQVLSDETKVHLRAEVRDKTFLPVSNTRVQGHVIGPDGLSESITLNPQPLEEGVYTADYNAEKPGSYLVEISNANDPTSRDVVMFRREDGVAENFRTTQNKELLEKLSEQTGGQYYSAGDAKRLADNISFSEAGITLHQNLDLWDMPIVLLLALCLRGGEWVLRRKWGVV